MRLLNRSAGRLSRHRRGPVAGLLVILLGLLCMGGLWTAFSPANAEKTEMTSAEKLELGRELFSTSCATCHGQNGEGIVAADGLSNWGPSLAGVGAAAFDFQLATGRMPMASPGHQAPRKTPAFSEEEIEALAYFGATLGAGPAVPDKEQYDLDTYAELNGLDEEQQRQAIVRGGALFLTNCTACHNFDGSGGAMPWGRYAPKLKGVESKHIYEAMLTGPQQMPLFSNAVLTPQDKRDIIAYIESIQDREETPAYGGFGMGGLGPVSEGLFAWLVGLGSLVGFAYWIAAHTARTEKKD